LVVRPIGHAAGTIMRARAPAEAGSMGIMADVWLASALGITGA